MFKSYFKKSFMINKIRNSFNFLPSVYLEPKIKKTSISDFFYFNLTNNFQTKLLLFNLSSHVLPECEQNEKVKFFGFDFDGNLIFQNEIILEYQETQEILISDFTDAFYGSFFAFHIFDNFGDLLEQNSFISERGYVAYKYCDSIWSFVHGNHNAAYLDNKNKIHSILASSFMKNNSYQPQVSFLDQENFELIINNPSNSHNKIIINLKDLNHKSIDVFNFNIKPFGTLKFSSRLKANLVEINSNFILNRPIIIKYYKNNFDIFHG